MAERRPDRVRGPLHDEFWRWCDQGELRLQSCARCGRLSWPVVAACEHCGAGELSWAKMSGRGKLASFCTFEYDYYNGALPVPYETILVELEEGPLFVSNPLGLTWRELEVGMPMRLAFLPCEDAAGPFQLPVFARA
jgi:uncharacterized OB-fold protein